MLSADAPPPAPSLAARPCAACAASKVRCDRGVPVCGRCMRIGLSCVEVPVHARRQKRKLGPENAKLLLQPATGAVALDNALMLRSTISAADAALPDTGGADAGGSGTPHSSSGKHALSRQRQKPKKVVANWWEIAAEGESSENDSDEGG